MMGASDPPGTPPDSSLERFAARVAHDFNNLLTGILGNLELLQLRAARNRLAGLDSYLEGANSAGTRATIFASRLMLFSGRGGSPAVPVPVDAALRKFAGRAQCQLAAGNAAVLCDPGQLDIAIAELLTNAAAAGGQASISTAMAGESVIVTVQDNGSGMTPEVLQCAPEPFFTTQSNGTGRGLGLPIVARILREIGGSMSITAEPEAGCTVTLTLPLS